MLKNLMKYDLQKMLKFLVWFYIASLAFAGITRLVYIWSNIQIMQIIGGVFASLTYSAVATIIINTFIHIIMRFQTSLFKDQSYLTHTLPVKKDTLILSKYLSSLLVIILSVAVSVLSLFIVLYSPEFMQGLRASLDAMVAGFNMSGGLFLFLIIAILFSQICMLISIIFTAKIKQYSYNQKRGLKFALWFIGFYLACTLVTVILVLIATAITGDISTLFAEQMSNSAFLTVLIIALITNILYALGFYFLSKKELKKGVNVD